MPDLEDAVIWEGKGLRVAGTDVWVDAQTPRQLGIITHAHADHVGDHARTLATNLTLGLLDLRRRPGALPCPYHQSIGLGSAQVTLLPSGHLPGGAQVLVEHGGLRILFTGDLYDHPQRFSAPLEPRHADVLVIEATYGTPQHRFPPRADSELQLREVVAETLAEGGTPLVLIEGSLGRAQETLAILHGAGHRLVASRRVFRWNQLYRRLGLEAAPCQRYAGRPARGSVLVYPMRSRGLKGLTRIKGLVRIACTGQPGGSKVTRRLGVEVRVPLVDHADFDGLIRYVEAVAPKQVLTVYGHAEALARELRERGWKAQALVESTQMVLNL